MAVNPEGESGQPSLFRSFIYVVALVLFWLCTILYFLILVYALYQADGKPWVRAGLLIGMLYIGSSIIAYYMKYLDEYHRSLRAVERDKKNGDDALRIRPLSLLVLWSVLNLTIQFFLLVGFWMTVEAPTLNENIYIHPCYYGRIYKHTDAMLTQMDAAFDTELLDESEKLEAYREKRDAFLVRFCEPHLEPKEPALPEKNEKKDGKTTENGTVQPSPEVDGQWSSDAASEAPGAARTDSRAMKEVRKSGSAIGRTPREIEEELYKIPFYVAIAFGFLGAMIYTLIDIRERVVSNRLGISCTTRYLIRFIVAPTVCLVFAYFISSDWWTHLAPIAFFCIGYCPDAAIRYMKEKLSLKSLETPGSWDGEAGVEKKEKPAVAAR